MGRLKIIAVLTWALSAGLRTTASADTPELRDAWKEARAAIRAGQHELSVDRNLRRYSLFPYLEAESIIAQLRSPEPPAEGLDRARDFLHEYADTAIEDAFRRELLYVLADREQWADFVDFYSPAVANESRECEYLSARIRTGQTADLAPLVARRWLTPRRLSSACEPAFEWLRQTGALGDAATAQRVEMLLDNGQTEFARIIARRLPEDLANVYRQWSQMLEDPLTSISGIANGSLVPGHEDILPAVWARASTNSPAQAFDLLPALLRVTERDADLTETLLRDLALGLAWDRRTESLEVFAQLPWSTHDDYSLGWLTRAALWNASWDLADRALASLSPAASAESGWTYWRARVRAQVGDRDAAAAAYSALLGRDNYYSAMAAARLGTRVTPDDQPVSAPDALIEELAQRPGFIRARELFFVEERVMATREWRYATADLDSPQLVAAVFLASQWHWHDMAVATATRAEVFFDYRLLYPRPFSAEIASAAASHALDQELLSGLIRQESMFRIDAVSSAGALGLAQLGIATARDTARMLGMAQPTRSDLFDASTNTRLGAATLRVRLARFDEQLPVALASYNAGPAAAARWLPDAPMDNDIWIENIPYNETREYVRRVIWNSIVYAWLDGGGESVDTRYLLGSIEPQSAADIAAGQ